MSELRAPDPTLTAGNPHQPIYVTWMEDATTAHLPNGCADARLREWEMEATDARWFAVPCRECFPDAPPPGHEGGCLPDCTGTMMLNPHLKWQGGS